MNDTPETYQRYWSVLTQRNEREIYVPLGIREETMLGRTPSFCSQCGDEFSPIEGTGPSDDPGDQCNFCSDACYERHHEELDARSAYDEAAWPAVVFP